ncbi:MAG: hypothetical protein F6J93_38165 [Oscillatoria sp. SIO1A7]|nr:hypothetical protein [Oscillatoria sp. SIO1A7]
MQLTPSLNWKERRRLNQQQRQSKALRSFAQVQNANEQSHWTKNLQADVVLKLIDKGRGYSTHTIEIILGEFISGELSIYLDSLKNAALFRDSDEINNFLGKKNGWLTFQEKLADPQATIANLAKDLREKFGVRVEVVEQIAG